MRMMNTIVMGAPPREARRESADVRSKSDTSMPKKQGLRGSKVSNQGCGVPNLGPRRSVETADHFLSGSRYTLLYPKTLPNEDAERAEGHIGVGRLEWLRLWAGMEGSGKCCVTHHRKDRSQSWIEATTFVGVEASFCWTDCERFQWMRMCKTLQILRAS